MLHEQSMLFSILAQLVQNFSTEILRAEVSLDNNHRSTSWVIFNQIGPLYGLKDQASKSLVNLRAGVTARLNHRGLEYSNLLFSLPFLIVLNVLIGHT